MEKVMAVYKQTTLTRALLACTIHQVSLVDFHAVAIFERVVTNSANRIGRLWWYWFGWLKNNVTNQYFTLIERLLA